MTELVSVLAGFLLLVWPAMRLARALGETPLLRAATTGLALCPALWFYACLALTPVGAVRRGPVLGLIGAAALWATLHWRRGRQGSWRFAAGTTTALVLVSFGWAIAVRLWPQGFGAAWPIGWDPSFHLALVRAMELGRGVPFTWMPFEATPVNYPLGMHAFLFVSATLSRVEAPLVFNVLITVVAPVFSGLAVARLALAVFDDPRIAWSAAAAYLWLADHGGVDSVRWGGLPSQWAVTAGLVFLARLVESDGESSWRDALLLAAIALTHHHAMLSTGLFILCWLAIRVVAERGVSSATRALAKHATVALLLAAPVTLPMVSRIFQIGESRVLRVDDDFPGLMVAPASMPGMVLVLLALAGCTRLLRANRLGSSLVVSYAASLVLGFVGGHYLARILGLLLSGEAHDAFTPTRFLGTLAFVAALPAGASLVGLWSAGRWIRHTAPLAALALAAVPVLLVRGQYRAPLPDGMAEAYAWIREHTPPESVIVSDEADKKWVAYLAAREVDEVPRPVSELVTPRVRAKRRIAKLLRAGPLLPDRFEEPGGPPLLTRPIFFVREARLDRPHLVLVFENERRFIYRYDPS